MTTTQLPDTVALTVPAAGGLVLLLTGLWVWWRWPRAAARDALLGVCVPAGLALMTGDDPALRAPHDASMAVLPAGLLHLALTFPIDRTHGRRFALLLLLYLPGLALAFVSQLVADDPSTQDAFRTVSAAATAAAGAVLVVALIAGIIRPTTLLLQRRSLLALLGAVAASLPAVVQLLRGGDGGTATLLAASAPTAFLFPIAIAVALATPGLIRMDDVLRQAVSGALLAGTVAATFLLTWFVAGALAPESDTLAVSPLAAALLNVAIVFLVVPLRDRARALSDRLLAPAAYDAEVHLAALSRGLASARSVETVVAHARNVLAEALRPSWATIYVSDGAQRFRPVGASSRRPVAVPPALLVAIDRGDPVLLDDGEALRDALPAAWAALDAALLMPLRASREVIGLLVLGRRASRRAYTPYDITFLRTAAYQIALGVLGGAAIDQLDAVNQRLVQLNANLEDEVAERTAALERKNAELAGSLAELQRTCRQLEQHHTGLLRSDRMATLGRLSAGFAHEVHTPLIGVTNTLAVIGDLGRAYAAAIDDPAVGPAEHRAIARQLIAAVQSASTWSDQAVACIRTVQSHDDEGRGEAPQRFAMRDVAEEARRLMAHRLRAAGCRVEIVEDSPAPTLVGNRGQLAQMLVNLITNAVDAYEERGIANGRITVHAAYGAGDGVRVRVTDWAGGIPSAILPRIFDASYTTKSARQGSGLGLWIARALVERGFGGTLDVLTSHGSSCFVADFPATACVAPAAEPSPRSARSRPVTAGAEAPRQP